MKPLNESHNNENPETVKSLNVASIRKSGKRYLMSVIICALTGFSITAVLGVGAWAWWSRPPTSAPLPAGIEEGHTVSLGRSTPPPYTDDGKLEAGHMRRENHQWVGSLRWTRTNEGPVTYDVHLGETVHIEGLGAVTLLQVNPPPLFFGDQQSGGWDYTFNINLAPGTTLCWNEHSYIQ